MTAEEQRCSLCGGTGTFYDEDAGRYLPCHWCNPDEDEADAAKGRHPSTGGHA